MTSDQVWEPYSKDFAERDMEARTISLLSAVSKRPLVNKAAASLQQSGRRMKGTRRLLLPPVSARMSALCQCIVSVAYRARGELEMPVELVDESSLAARSVAAVNVSVTDTDGDGSRESVRIALLTAALNDLDVLRLVLTCSRLTSVRPQAKEEKNYYIIAGPEFGSNAS
jgi:hypothetical protein